MSLLGLNKRGHIVSEEVITWIVYLAIAIAVGFAIKMMIGKFGG